MLAEDSQSILRCVQCNKPFDKESTLKRHGYYCRSRRIGTATRPRSCHACADAKARCDHRRPECSRCTANSIDCNYPEQQPKSLGSENHHDHYESRKRRRLMQDAEVETANIRGISTVSYGDTIVDDILPMPELDATILPQDGFLNWAEPDLDFNDILNEQTLDEMTGNLSPNLTSTSLTRLHTIPTNQSFEIDKLVPTPRLSIILPTQNPRSLTKRSEIKHGTQKISDLILSTLKSYPTMILRNKTLPPFIHPKTMSPGFHDCDMEPLNNCMSLVHMYNNGIHGSRKLFWRNVKQECERFCEEHRTWNGWTTLAAMQALAIYIIIRLDEGETEYNDFDFLLLTSVTKLAVYSTRRVAAGDARFCTDGHDLESTWKQWAYEESIRRICLIYQTMNMLIYFEPAALCDIHDELILAPLPSSKQLWQAGDASTWQAEFNRESSNHIAYGLAADGELVKLFEGEQYCDEKAVLQKPLNHKAPARGLVKWEEWCSGMDEMGGLVMLAASLLG